MDHSSKDPTRRILTLCCEIRFSITETPQFFALAHHARTQDRYFLYDIIRSIIIITLASLHFECVIKKSFSGGANHGEYVGMK